jgi:hypothetical protein
MNSGAWLWAGYVVDPFGVRIYKYSYFHLYSFFY